MFENRLQTPQDLEKSLDRAWHRLWLPPCSNRWRENTGPGSAADSCTAPTFREGPGAAVGMPHGRQGGLLFTAGTVVAGRYRIASILGRGGMGEVYRADDLKLHQAVALKRLVPARASDPAAQAGLRREVRLARGISHPNVCRVFDLVEAEGENLLAMELIDGEDLASRLARRGRLPVEEAVAITRQIAAGLAAIHDGGLVHCDIKPANVQIDGRGRARILDFGVAVVADEPSAGSRAGTPAYMAPEQRARGEVSVRTDIYSLGLVLYEMVTGRPFLSPEAAPGPLEVLQEGVDAGIGAVLARCLATDPAGRPASALAVWEALGRARGHGG
jgi:serine/threonine protein kinase